MEYKFTQYEVESAISKILAFGDETEIAKRTGRGASYYSQMFNPDEDRESNIHKVLKEVCAEIDIDFDRGMALFNLFKSFIERHIVTRLDLSVNEELDKADKEFGDIWKARLQNKPPSVQLTEIVQAETQLNELKRAVVCEVAKEEIRFNNNFKPPVGEYPN